MIDIHTHLLPNVDDGSYSLKASLNMLKAEYDDGVRRIIITPHFRGEYRLCGDELKNRFEDFKKAAAAFYPDVDLRLGQEIFYNKGSLSAIESGELFTLAGGKYVLLEFPFVYKTDIAEAVYETVRRGFLPVVAHVERYCYATEALVREIKDLGGFIQVNANAVADRGPCAPFVRKLLNERLVDFVASDLHQNRFCMLKKAYENAVKRYGREYSDEIFSTNAQKIIERL